MIDLLPNTHTINATYYMKFVKYILFTAYHLINMLISVSVLFKDPQWLSRIDYSAEYEWWQGAWHAYCWFPHIGRNIFVETNCISHNGTIMYYVLFGLVLVAIPCFNLCLSEFSEKVFSKT